MVSKIFEEIIDNYMLWATDKSNIMYITICKDIWNGVKCFYKNDIITEKEYDFLKHACAYYLKDMDIK